MNKKSIIKKGFTLVELVVVIAVIAILAAVSVGAYFGVTKSAEDSKLTQEAKVVDTLLRLSNNHGATLNSDGINIENISILNEEVNRASGAVYYLTLDLNDVKSDSYVVQFERIDTTLDSNQYDYFRYFTKGNTSRYCLWNLKTSESKCLDYSDTNVSVDEVKEENENQDKTPLAVFTFDNSAASEQELIEINENNNLFRNGSYELKLDSYKHAFLGLRGSASSGTRVLALINKTTAEEPYINFTVPNEVKSVTISYLGYRSSYSTQLRVNDTLLGSYKESNVDKLFVTISTINNKTINIASIKDTKANINGASIKSISYYA